MTLKMISCAIFRRCVIEYRHNNIIYYMYDRHNNIIWLIFNKGLRVFAKVYLSTNVYVDLSGERTRTKIVSYLNRYNNKGYNIMVVPSTVWFFQCRWPANELVCRRKTGPCPFYAVSSSPTYCRHWRRFQTEVANHRYPAAPRTRPSDRPSLRHH